MTDAQERPLDASLQAFLDYLKFEKDYSANTLAAYRRDLDRFAAMTLEAPDRVSRSHIDTFVARLHSEGLAPRSIQRALSSVRSFFKYLEARRETKKNPAAAARVWGRSESPPTSRHSSPARQTTPPSAPPRSAAPASW